MGSQRKRVSRGKEEVVAFRGAQLTKKDFRRIQRLIGRTVRPTRQQIARETCRLFGWRRGTGAPPIRACRDLLVRLDKLGVIRLPAARKRGKAKKKGAFAEDVMEHLLLTEADYEGEVSSQGSLVIQRLGDEEKPAFRAYMKRYHYLGDSPLVGESVRYAVFVDGELVALLGFGGATRFNGPRDRHIGWDEAARRARLHLVVNNGRYLVLPWIRAPNLASRVLGSVLRRLSRDYEAVYGHPVLMVETFVDPSRFRGTCYRASNWIRVGQTKGWSRHGQQYKEHGHRKDVYVYALKRHALRELRAPLCEGAKMRRKQEVVLDVEKLPLEGKEGLFSVFSGLTDTRHAQGLRHSLRSVLAVATCAVLAGQRSFVAIEEWARDQSRETLNLLGCWYRHPPSERTFRRVLKHIVNPEEIDERLGTWVARQQGCLAGMGISIDGKTLRGSKDGEKAGVHLLSAVVHGKTVVVAQTRVDEKTNEITRVRPLLSKLDIEGSVVTADAMHAQTETAKFIVEEKRADYVITVKENQPTLRQDIADEFELKRKSASAKKSSKSLHREAFPPCAQDI